MKRKNVFQLAILLVLGLGVLFSLVAFDNPYFWQSKQLVEISVIVREADSTGWGTARQGMEQAAADLDAELRFLTLSSPDSVEEQKDLLAREVAGGGPGDRAGAGQPTADGAGGKGCHGKSGAGDHGV